MSKRLFVATAAALAFSAAAFPPTDAHACGGLFCDGSGPTQVNQAAERIIFAQNPDGSVTAVVEIMYQGPADQFGWLLPVPGIPEVGLSSNIAMQRLQTATNPQYQLSTTFEGECRSENNGFAANDGAANNGTTANNGQTNNGSVAILDRGTAGPYDYVVLQIDGDPQIGLDWLADNGYQVTSVGPELLTPYIDDGYNLLAIRLQKNADSGSVRPIRLTYDDDHPMIPIKLTAVAANQDMGVLTWVLGQSRAIPVNYKSLVLNDALIDWLNFAQNYNQVVIAAANEASGQGFVTEYADDTGTLAQLVFTQFDGDRWQSLGTQDWTGREVELLEVVIAQYGAWDGVADAIDQALPNLTAEQRDNILTCGVYCEFQNGDLTGVLDPPVFLSAVFDLVIEPMQKTQELLDSLPYVTRLYTTLSPHEMTVDPSFDFNPDLGDVSNIHNATRVIECSSAYYQWEAPWRVELPSGLVVRGEGGAWPVQPTPMMPATIEVRQVGTSGEGDVVRDNRTTIEEQLAELAPEIRTPTDDDDGSTNGGGGPGATDDEEPGPGEMLGDKEVSGGGCSVAAGGASSVLWLLPLLVMGVRRRR